MLYVQKSYKSCVHRFVVSLFLCRLFLLINASTEAEMLACVECHNIK